MTIMHPTPYNTRIPPTISPDAMAQASVPPSYVNPIQTQSTEATSSLLTSVPLKKRAPSNGKRKRTDTPDSGDSTSQKQKTKDGPRKKKANRACFHCQKAHLTCDDSRPCQRCIKRGIANSCTEGHRKKAKYLLDEEELEQLKGSKQAVPDSSQEPPPIQPTTDPFPINDQLFSGSFDTNFSFGSEAANMEYSILSAILGNPSPPESGSPPPQSQYPQNLTNAAWPTDYGSNGYSTAYGDQQMAIQPSETTLSPNFMTGYPSPQFQAPRDPTEYPPQYHGSQHHPPPPCGLQPRFSSQSLNNALSATSTNHPTIKEPPISGSLVTPPASNASPSSSSSVPLGSIAEPILVPSRGSSQLQTINDLVTSPYDYTEGYHFLMKHLPSRFEKNDILRIVRALAIFRPSLIALQMPLSVEDEVFVEKCFQRSLLELDKLISFSGTPTVVWRRTGEICLVAPEFCLLTGWSMDDLVGHRKYIYELFENQSAVEYWESFASHAFENTTQSVYSHCVLLKPSGAPIPATFCFSIRRDIFDLPSVVIGQWLPLL